MRNLFFVLMSFLFFFMLVSTGSCIYAQALKGFTLGAALPTHDKHNTNDVYYLDEKQVSVSGVDGNLIAIFQLESIGFEDYDKIFDSRSDIEKLTVAQYTAKWGVPIITSIEFLPDRAVLCSGRYVDGRFIYQEGKSQFAQNVSDFYSVKLKFDERKRHWTGENNNLKIVLTDSSLSLIDIKLDAKAERERAEYKRKKALQQAKDF